MNCFQISSKLIFDSPPFAIAIAMAVAGSLIIGAIQSDRQLTTYREFAYGCDGFGYLQSAKIQRNARIKNIAPNWSIDSPRFVEATSFLLGKGYSPSSFKGLLGPYSVNQFSRTGKLGIQYPPGTGLILSLFEEGVAVPTLNRFTIITLLGIFLVLLGWATTRSWQSVALVGLSGVFAFHELPQVQNRSFSINAIYLPLLLCGLLAWIVSERKPGNKRLSTTFALFLSFLSGILLGFCILARIPSLLFIPGFILLFSSWKDRASFLVGTILTGFFPWASYNSILSGAWYLPTYGSQDTATPSWGAISFNLNYYLGTGEAAGGNEALQHLLAGVVGVFLGLSQTRRWQWGRSRKFWGVFLLWIVPLLFFVTHSVVEPYYMISANVLFCFVAALACASQANLPKFDHTNPWKNTVALLFSIIPLIYITNQTRLISRSAQWNLPVIAPITRPIIPRELANPHAWIWSELAGGSFWYYGEIPTFKLGIVSPEVGKALMLHAHEKREPQFLLKDGDGFQSLFSIGESLGGKWRYRGKFGEFEYYQLEWPEGTSI